MTTRFYRFPDNATFVALLPEGAVAEGERYHPLPDNVIAMRVIGTIYKEGSAVFNEAGDLVTPPTPLDGWHVNILGEAGTAWAAYEIHPVSPRGVFGE